MYYVLARIPKAVLETFIETFCGGIATRDSSDASIYAAVFAWIESLFAERKEAEYWKVLFVTKSCSRTQ